MKVWYCFLLFEIVINCKISFKNGYLRTLSATPVLRSPTGITLMS